MMAVSRPGVAPPEMPFSSSRFWLRVGECAERWAWAQNRVADLELQVACPPLQLANADCTRLPSARASASPTITHLAAAIFCNCGSR